MWKYCAFLAAAALVSSAAGLAIDHFQPKSFFSIVPHDENSCVGRCNQQGTIPGAPCQCNRPCQDFGDCCSDYVAVCLSSCVGRCDQPHNSSAACQCNKPCANFGDCCPDYNEVCDGSSGPGDVSNAELAALSEELLLLDVNNVAQFVSVNLQANTTSGSTADRAPLPLLTLTNGAYIGPTISKLLPLHSHYFPEVERAEVDTPIDMQQRTAFIDAIFETEVMQRTQEFLASKGLPNGKDNFHQIWFEHYTRSNGALGSSGFEHVFLGELKNGVSGFHNWLYFAREENNENLNYRGYMDTFNLQTRGSIVEHNFAWRNGNKPISSMFIGTSPEFELSIYTVCFYARKNAKCPITFNGQRVQIQTYNLVQNSKTYVATSYPDLSD